MSGLVKRIRSLAAPVLVVVAIIVAIAVASIAAAGYWLAATNSGLNWLCKHLLPANISYQTLQGDLASGVSVNQLNIVSEGADIQIAQVKGRWQLLSILGGQFSLDQLAAQGVTIRLKQQSETEQPPTPWPSLHLPLPVNIARLTVNDLHIQQQEASTTIDHIALQGIINPLQTRINQLTVESAEGNIAISGRIGNQFPYGLTLDSRWQYQYGDQLYQGEGKLSGSINKLSIDHRLSSPFSLLSAGALSLASNDRHSATTMSLAVDSFTVDLQNQWQDANLASYGIALTSSGALQVKGTPLAYSLSGQSHFATNGETTTASDNPATQALQQLAGTLQLSLAATGNLQSATIENLDLQTNQGSAAIKGDLNWQQGISWTLKAVASDLETQAFLPRWPARLSADFMSSGQWQQGKLATGLVIERLDGELLGYSIDGSGELEIGNTALADTAYRIMAKDLDLRMGSNQLRANGVFDQQSSLEWHIDGNNLAEFGPDFGGKLLASGALSGRLDDSQTIVAQGSLQGENLRIPGWALEKLSVTLTPPNAGDYNLDASITGLNGAGIKNTHILLKGRGTLAQHRIDASYRDAGNHIDLTATGGYQHSRWQGMLATLNLASPYTGNWLLAKAASIEITSQQLLIPDFCLQQNSASLCGALNKKGEQLSASGTLHQVPLSPLTQWLPPGSDVEGQLNGDFRITAKNGKFEGDYQLHSSNGAVLYKVDSGDTLRQGFTLNARGNLPGTSSSMAINTASLLLENVGTITANLDVGLDNGNPVNGQLQGQINSLPWLQALTTAIAEPQGQITADITIVGSLANPQVAGWLKLHNLAAIVPAAGIHLSDGQGQLSIDANRHWQFDASINSADKPISFNGSGDYPVNKTHQASVRIKGEDIVVVDLPDTQASISPDMVVNFDGQAIKITGELAVPSAMLVIHPEPEGITPVSDDEMITPATATTKPQSPLQITSDLNLSLGENVQLEALGLSTGLRGTLRLRKKTTGLPQARGTISLHDGSYEAYGQKLKVTRGLLLFQGVIDNPGLNIIASRKTPTATVGLEIGGTAQDIKSKVFSDPALPATEALTILVTGKPLTDINQSDANHVANAATALGISQSDWITSRLQTTLGVDVLSLEGGDSYVDSSLVVGKYLSSKLFVSYIQKLFSPQGSFALQYQLGDRLGIRAESGATQSVDLLYKVQH